MSGHSKWSTIKRQKGVTDAKRGQAFTKAANAITIAAREGGESPETNFKLRLVIDAARNINMPKGNIERAVSRGVGKGSEVAKLENITYEGFGPAGVAILISVVTDNKQRSAQEIRSVLERGGGRLTGQGSVAYLFKQIGQIDVEVEDESDPDHIILAAADVGALDADVFEKRGVIYCEPAELDRIKKELESHHLKVHGWQISMKPENLVKIAESEQAKKVLDLMSKLEDLSDVQKVYANFDIPDEILQKETT